MSLYDRPALNELIDAAQMHFETTIIQMVRHDPKLYYQTLVAINILKIASREAAQSAAHQRQNWAGLDALEGSETGLPKDAVSFEQATEARQTALCAAIRAGDYDDRTDALLDYLLAATRAQLEVANPKFLETLESEDAFGP